MIALLMPCTGYRHAASTAIRRLQVLGVIAPRGASRSVPTRRFELMALAALVWPQVHRALEETPTAESAVVASEEGCCICQGADDSHGK